jgi:hypothetical protein
MRSSSCFGCSARDSGHNRVPEPPDRMMGTIGVGSLTGAHGIAETGSAEANRGSFGGGVDRCLDLVAGLR